MKNISLHLPPDQLILLIGLSVLLLLPTILRKTFVPIRNFLEKESKKYKTIRKCLVTRRRRKSDSRYGIAREYYKKHLKASQDLMAFKILDRRQSALRCFHRYKTCLYQKEVDDASEYINFLDEQTQEYNDKNKLLNKLLYSLSLNGGHKRHDRKMRYLMKIILERQEQIKPLLDMLEPTEEYFDLFSEDYVPKLDTAVSTSDESKTTIGNLTEEQTNEFWDVCNKRFFKNFPTKSAFLSSFQVENEFTLEFANDSTLYVFCPFVESKSSLYEPEDRKPMLDKILKKADIDEEKYRRNAKWSKNGQWSNPEKENHKKLHDFFAGYGML